MNKLDLEYIRITKEILEKGFIHDDRTGTGTKRIFGSFMKIDLADGFPMLTTRKLSLRIAAEELIWMLSGSTNSLLLKEKNVKIWDGNGSAEECAKFNRVEGDLGEIYGHQWRNFGATKKPMANEQDEYSQENQRWINKAYNDDGFDQIKEIVKLLTNNPNSRRIVLSSWNPKDVGTVNPPPCHYTMQLSVINNKINMLMQMRSNDFFLGAPTNFLFYGILIHLLATTCNLEVGEYNHVVGDTHIYLDHIDQMKIQIEREPFPLPKLIINDRLKGKGFEGLMDFKYEDLTLVGYQSHGVLKGKMSV